MSKTEADYRLPRTAIPSHYELVIEPDLPDASFVGTVVVTLDVLEATKAIQLNSAELEITSAHLLGADGSSRDGVADIDEGSERATLSFGDELAPGPYRLTLGFAGILNDQLRGFYLSRYKDADGAEQVLASTQFEATEARRAFPCWDEPDLKATYDITLIVDPKLQAVSNSPIVSDDQTEDGRRRVTFGTTMKMSTYLVAFVVGELEATEWVDVDGVPLRIVHVPGKGHLTDFALEVGTFALRFFTDYYGIPYPGEKVDMIGIPDFAFGAMENLGAITYRESVLLVDTKKATQAEMQRVADVICHELAHMWFGDLVTMKWWNGIWLNEAFATFMELAAVHAFRPEWKRWLSFAAERNGSMDIDGLATTRPIEFPVASPEEANEMFDVLTYAKGGAVLRMLEQYLGEETFRRGVSRYLKTHAYGNTETADLWAALEAESGEPVKEIMEGWILQGGHPRLEVSREGDGYSVTQEHFRFIGDSPATWSVPVLYESTTGTGRVLVEGATSIGAGDDLLVNAGGQGYYRTDYSGELLGELADRITDLDPYERYAVVSDTWANVLSGDTPATGFLDVVGRLADETEADVWNAMLGGLGELSRVVSSDVLPDLQGFVRDLVARASGRMGWEPGPGESDLERALRGVLLRASGVLGKDQATIAEAHTRFGDVLDPGADVDGDVAAAVVAIVASNGDIETHTMIARAYENASTPQDEARLVAALPAIPDREAAEETLEMILDGRVRSHDAARTTARLIANPEVGADSWQRVTEHWDDLIARMPALTARSTVESVHFRSEPDMAAAIHAWLSDHKVPGAEKYVPQQLERLDVRVALRDREQALEIPLG